MPALIIEWLVAHQAIAAGLAAWLGLTAAGVDVADKATQFYRDTVGPATIEKATTNE